MLSCRHLWKIYGRSPADALRAHLTGDARPTAGHVTAVADVSFDVQRGETFVVMGLSGSGKSTLVRCIARLTEPTAGEVLLDGVDVLRMKEAELREMRRRKVAMVFQNFGLLPHRTVFENVTYGLELRGESSAVRAERAMQMIELVGLRGWEKHLPRTLSGGMQQRVGLARALAVDPELLLLDEPFSALDATMRSEVRTDALSILRSSGTTAVMVTHDQEEAMAFADHLVVLLDGRVAQAGAPSDVYNAPASLAVARFIGQANLLPGVAASGSVRFDLGTCPSDGREGRVVVLVRPEHVRPVGPESDGVDGVVEARSYYGHDGSLAVRVPSGALVVARVSAESLIPVGSRVRLGVDRVTCVFPDEASTPPRA